MGGPENGNFSLLHVMKMSLPMGWVVLKSLKTPLRNIKMVPSNAWGVVNHASSSKRSMQYLELQNLLPWHEKTRHSLINPTSTI